MDNVLKMTLSRNSNRLYPQFKLLKQSPPVSSVKISSFSGCIMFGVWLCGFLNMNLFLPASIKTPAAFGTSGPLLAGLSCARTPSSLESGLLTVIGMLAWHQGRFFFSFIYLFLTEGYLFYSIALVSTKHQTFLEAEHRWATLSCRKMRRSC